MPIALSKAEWARIVHWTDSNKEDPEVLRRREYVRHLDSTSRAMTKSWPNSLENVNKRNEELRQARIDAAEQTNNKFYKRYVKRQREEQQRLMHSARDMVFKNKDAPKLLLSAVIETAIQKEREAQLEFKAERIRAEAEAKRQDDDEIIRRAKEWHELMDSRKKKRFEMNKKHQQEILEQAQEVSERDRLERETELQYQKLDNIKADEQMDAIREFEAKFKADEKKRIWSDMERARQEAAEQARGRAALERMDDRLLAVLLNSRARTERRRKQTEKEVKDEKMRVLEKISQKLESGDAVREAKETANLNKAIKEKQDKEDNRVRAQERKLEQFRADRRAARQKFLLDEEQRLHEFHTKRQWDLMNRFKNCELYEDYQVKLRKEKERKIKEYKEDILKLWRERDERVARERAETRYFYGELALKKMRDADNKLLTHAAGLVEEARRHGRPDHAIKQAVDRYCKLYRLYPMPELPKSMQEHFQPYAPWDGSAPDPWYKEPPPPPPDLGPDAPDEEEPPPQPPTGKRDGLQPLDKVGPSTSAAAATRKQPAADYKRAGRADGLQQRHAQIDLKLPPLASSCPDPACTCTK